MGNKEHSRRAGACGKTPQLRRGCPATQGYYYYYYYHVGGQVRSGNAEGKLKAVSALLHGRAVAHDGERLASEQWRQLVSRSTALPCHVWTSYTRRTAASPPAPPVSRNENLPFQALSTCVVPPPARPTKVVRSARFGRLPARREVPWRFGVWHRHPGHND